MENGGNTKVNAIFEARLNVPKPSNQADLQTRERFIRDKYERRKFYDPAAFTKLAAQFTTKAQPPPAARQSSAADMDMPPLSSAHQANQAFGNMGAPSAAAKKRLESRKSSGVESTSSTAARGRVSGPASSAAPKTRSKSVAAQPKSQPVGDLIDFNASSDSFGKPKSKQKKAPSTDLMGFPDDCMSQASSGTNKTSSRKKASGKSKGQDEFADFASAASNSSSGDFGDFASAPAAAAKTAPKATAPKATAPKAAAAANTTSSTNKAKNTSSDSAQSIMSLYNTNPGNAQGFGANGGMAAMNNSALNNSMGNMSTMMQQMSIQNNNNNNAANSMAAANTAMSPNSMQQQAMMYQQHMKRLQQMQRQQNVGVMMMMHGNNNNNSMNGGMNPMGGGNTNMPFPNLQIPTPQPMGGMPAAAARPTTGAQPNKAPAAAADPFASLSARQGF